MSTTIRRATVQDADDIATVHVAGWRAAYQELLPADLLASLSISDRADMWRTRLADDDTAVWIAEDGHFLLGFASAGPSRYRDAPSTTGELYALYIHPARWAAGVGTLLLATAVAHLDQQFTAATLWVLRGNARARRFYEHNCWQPDGSERVEQRFHATLDEVRYARELTS